MKLDNTNSVIHKDVIIIGNGPSGIALSYMLSGNIPYITSNEHPDEMLSARLAPCIGKSLIHQDLEYLSDGLEGRTTNPVSLLLDSLMHPCADIGLDMDPLVVWRKNGVEIDHVVFGKGPPGGSWHAMDPHILTLSLGTWMGLPGLKYQNRDGAEKRAFACNVARYYEDYVKEMDLTKHFKCGVIVMKITPLQSEDVPESARSQEETWESFNSKWVQKIYNDVSHKIKFCTQPESEDNDDGTKTKQETCRFTSALNFILSRGQRRLKTDRCCKRKFESTENKSKIICASQAEQDNLVDSRDVVSDIVLQRNELRQNFRNFNMNCDKNRSVSFSCDYDSLKYSSDNLYSKSFNEQVSFFNFLRNSCSLDSERSLKKIPKIASCNVNATSDPTTSNFTQSTHSKPKWLVEVYDTKTKTVLHYTCGYLVLANGASDLPNKLAISNNKHDPSWLLHDVKSLEIELDLYLQYSRENIDPVIVVGAGLSAADAIIAARGKNVPVLHVFRNKSADLSKQLPENMYPEYHKVHQMMQDGGSTYPLYTSLPEYTLTDYCESTRTVTLTSNEGKEVQYKVSFVVVLIGARPDLSFLPDTFKIGVNQNAHVDSKTNPININKLNHCINGYENVYAIGPISGDNFVRFLPGGAVAIISDLYKKFNN